MSANSHPAATSTQKVVTAMWSLQQPATAKKIAEAAAVGYSTVTPILRNLLAEQQATKTEADGCTLWHLTASAPTDLSTTDTEPSAAFAAPDDAEPSSDATDATDLPPSEHTADAAQPDDTARSADAITTDDDTGTGAGDESSAEPGDVAPEAGATAPVDVAETHQHETRPQESDDRLAGTRAYRKPTLPRRDKGSLRAAVLKVLTDAPDRGFKISELCKAIDAVATDTNKAGAGAVANAATKLVNDGQAVQMDEKPATFTAAPTAAETD